MDSLTLQKLAQQFMVNAVRTQPGDHIWVEYRGPKAKVLAETCAAKVEEIGGHPFLVDTGAATINSTVGPLSAEGIAALGNEKLVQMKGMQGYIRVDDDADQAKITLPPEQMVRYKRALQAVNDYRVNHTRWLVTAAPTEELAAACGMSFADFETFYRDVCLIEYGKMTEAVKPLEKLMAEGRTVRIHSPAQETDLSFSIEGVPAIPCTGTLNIPDGECFTAPVKDSIQGTIRFGPSVYDGQKFAFIRLTFQDGRIEEAQAENAERTAMLNRMLDTDPARATWASFRSTSTLSSGIRRAASCSMKRSTAESTWRWEIATIRLRTGTSRRCIGTWCTSSGRITAAGSCISTAA
jgi:aminopeptidase